MTSLYLILISSFLLRLVNLNQSFWLDEAAQMIESSRSLAQQFQLAADFHPPLYHLLMHFWLKSGNSEVYARFPQVIFAVCSVYLIFKISQLLKLGKFAIFSALLLSVSPFHIYYSQEVRPYMLFSLLSLLSIYHWLKSDFKYFLISNIFLIYTNYFASFLLCGVNLTAYFFRKKLFNRTLKTTVLAYLFFLPWLPYLLEQFHVGFSTSFRGWQEVVSEGSIRIIPLTFAKFIIGKVSVDNNLLYFLTLLPVFLIFIYCCRLIYSKKSGKILLSLFFIPLILSFITSIFLPIVAPQRLIFLLPLFLIIISLALVYVKKIILKLFLTIILLTSFLGLFLYYTDPKFQREDWRGSVDYLNKNAHPFHLILFSFPEPFAPFLWYNRQGLNAKGIAPEFIVSEKNSQSIAIQVTNKQEVYYYGYLTDLTDPDKIIDKELIKLGFKLSTINNFHGVGFLYKYEKQ